MTPRTYCLDDEDNSSLSDYDSEWTQVSGLEDDDFPPLSAASERSSSRAGTIDEGIDVDVWEGLADGLHRSFSRLSDTQCSVDGGATREALTCEDTQSLSASVATKFSEDDDRVNVALNSSVIGTLRASRTRSASSSLHASLTESQSKLRLSFPDPLSSSKDDTGDDHDPQQIDFKSHNLAEDDSKPNITSVASSFSDIEGPATLEASEKSDKNAISTVFQPIPIYASCILSIALYGSASSSKWQIVDRIMSLVLQFNDTNPSIVEDGCNRRYYFESSVLKNQFTSLYEQFFVRIIDRTSSSSEMEFTDTDDGVPSLAILLLPSSLPSTLPKHDYYLPLISSPSLSFGFPKSSSSSAFSESVVSDSAQYTWESLEVPHEKLIVLNPQRPKTIWDVAFLNDQQEAILVSAFSVIFSGGRTKTNTSNNQEKQHVIVNKWYTLALVAATALAVAIGGIRMNKLPGETAVSSNLSNTNLSVNSAAVGSISSASILPISSNQPDITSVNSVLRSLATVAVKSLTTHPSSTKSLIHDSPPVSSSDIEYSSVDQALGSRESESSLCECLRRPKAWLDKLDIGIGDYVRKDIMDRPTTALSLIGRPPMNDLQSPRQAEVDGGRKSSTESSALSLRSVQNSIAHLSSKSKALMKTGGRDMSILNEALDELLIALGRQVDRAKTGMDKAKTGAVHANDHMRHTLAFRNARARENAKRIRSVGEKFIKAASEGALKMASQVRDRTRTHNNEEAVGSHQSKKSHRVPELQLKRQEVIRHQGIEQTPEEKQQVTGYNRRLHRRLLRRERVDGR